MKKLKVLKSYSQRDSRWGNILLGYNTNLPYTIGNFGCLITCLANYVGKTPTEINNTLKANNGFVSGGLFVWGKSTTIGLTQTYVSPFYSDAVSTYGLNKMRELIDNGYPLLTEVDFYPSTVNEDMHFVLVIGYDDNDIFYAIDPWTGTEVNLTIYGGVKRAVYQFRAYNKKLDFINSEPIMADTELQKKLDIYFNQVVSPDFVTSFLEERRREIDKLNENISNKETVISRLQENMRGSGLSLPWKTRFLKYLFLN